MSLEKKLDKGSVGQALAVMGSAGIGAFFGGYLGAAAAAGIVYGITEAAHKSYYK